MQRNLSYGLRVLVVLAVVLLPLRIMATDAVFDLRVIALNEVKTPLASNEGLFIRYTYYRPSPAVRKIDSRSGFLLLVPQDPSLSVPKVQEPELVIEGLMFKQPYALISPGQKLFIRNKSSFDLELDIKMGKHKESIKVPAGKRISVPIAGMGDGMVSCPSFRHLKAFIFRSEPGYLVPIRHLKDGDNKVIVKNVLPGTYVAKIWSGKWWTTQPIKIEGDKPVRFRIDIDGTSKEQTVEAIENLFDESVPIKQKATPPPQNVVQPVVPKSVTQQPVVPAKKEVVKQSQPSAAPKKTAPKPKKSKPAVKKPAPKKSKKKSSGGGFKIKKIKEEGAKKTKKKPAKPAGGGFLKIKKVEGE